MKQFLQKFMILAGVFCLTSFYSFSQGTITGKVLDDRGETLPGANVFIKGTTLGTITDFDGNFKINKVPSGAKVVVYSFVGFDDLEKEVTVQDGGTVDLGETTMVSNLLGLDEIEIVASRSTVESPFTFTDVKKKDIQMNLGSRDLPLALNVTPSFYSTNSGGGAGDARLNVRGFNQRNVAIMINGVPVNDMENGWVYWSNWDGLGDAAHSIQVQRGMSPVNLAVPSIGGTMNIITDPAGKAQSTSFKQEVGSWNFRKTTLTYNSGLIDDKLAISGTLVRKTGDGFYQGLYTDAWAYYLGMSYQLNDNNKLEAFLIGAPQKHGQNLYAQNIARYDHDFASSLDGYEVGALNRYREAGRDFNQNYGGVSPTYGGKQYSGTYSEGIRDRSGDNYIMERENYFHKPQFNMNWHHTFSDKMQMTTIGYWSGGRGGGSGTFGSVATDYSYSGMGVRQWDAEIAQNMANDDGTGRGLNRSTGILRNSRNNQYTIGLISKMFIDVNENLKIQFGVDWRTAEIEHYREVRDLLGGDYYLFTGDQFATEPWQMEKGLGDKLDYDFTNTVSWIGFYGQGTYKINNLTTFLMGGFTNTKYTHTNHFIMGPGGGELEINPDALSGFQVKTGASYIFSRDFNVYANYGYISKNPNLDRVIDDESFVQLADPENQTFSSLELGLNYKIGSNVAFNVNYYNTLWSNRTQKESIENTATGNEFFTLITGIEQRNSGFEVEGSYQPTPKLRFDAAMSFANWEFLNNTRVVATNSDAQGVVQERVEGTLYIKGLKEGDAPQNQFTVAATYNPFKNMTFKLDYRYYSKFYSAFNPVGRIVLDTDNMADASVQERMEVNPTWEVPSFGVVDFHAIYSVPMKETAGFKLELFAHVFNLFNKVYIQDATDNSAFNSYDGDHDADDAEVFLGLPRNYNMGVTVRF